jgi:hypothetical protein
MNGDGLGFVYERPYHGEPQWKPRRITEITAKKVFYERPKRFAGRGETMIAWAYRADMECFFCAMPFDKEIQWYWLKDAGHHQAVYALPDGAQANLQGYLAAKLERKEAAYKQAQARRYASFDASLDAMLERLRPASRADAALLGLSGDFTREDAERAFRAKAKLAHPDHGGDAIAFQQLVAARDRILSAML